MPNQGENVMENKVISFTETLAAFLEDIDRRDLSKATYRKILVNFYKYLVNDKKSFTAIKKIDLLKYRDGLISKNAPRTINMYMSVIKSFYAYMDKYNVYGNKEYLGIRKEHVPATLSRASLSEDQVRQLLLSFDLNSVKGKRDHLLITLMINAGLRRIEIHRLNINDVVLDKDRCIIKLHRKGYSSNSIHKTVSSNIYTLVSEWVMIRKESDSTRPLFVTLTPGKNAIRLSEVRVSQIVKESLKRIGLVGSLYSAHSLRHTTADLMVKAGRSLQEIQLYLGHASLATTQNYLKTMASSINSSPDISDQLFGITNGTD